MSWYLFSAAAFTITENLQSTDELPQDLEDVCLLL